MWTGDVDKIGNGGDIGKTSTELGLFLDEAVESGDFFDADAEAAALAKGLTPLQK